MMAVDEYHVFLLRSWFILGFGNGHHGLEKLLNCLVLKCGNTYSQKACLEYWFYMGYFRFPWVQNFNAKFTEFYLQYFMLLPLDPPASVKGCYVG